MTYNIHQSPFIRPDLYDQLDELALDTVNSLEVRLDALGIALQDDLKEEIYETILNRTVESVLDY